MHTPPSEPVRYKAVVSYDGTAYAGYQIQPGHPTIQSELESSIRKISGKDIRVFASGRTDQGVHARGQVVHFDLESQRATDRLLRGLNATLPPDIRIESLRRVHRDFDARFSAKRKEYRYFIWNSPVLTPDVRAFRAHVYKALDVEAMQAAARRLEGRHDFAAFSANPQREVDGTVRSVFRIRVSRRGSEVVISAEGEGFLYKMVRSLAGFLIRVGTGELPPESADRILASKRRTAEVPTAPAEGLFLWRVMYR